MARQYLAAALVLLAVAAAATAKAEVIFTATLSHDQETVQGVLVTSTGDPRDVSFGEATFTLSSDETSLTMSATIFNIDVTGLQTPTDTNDNLNNAHIHAGLTAVLGQNSPVVWGFFGAPFNDTDGDVVVTPFLSGVGGTFVGTWDLNEGQNTTLSAQLPFIFAGLSYINFHTTQFPAGEIRGQIAAVPEPAVLMLMMIALAGLAFRGRSARLTKPARGSI